MLASFLRERLPPRAVFFLRAGLVAIIAAFGLVLLARLLIAAG
jgi:hypothetical protein